MLGVSPYQRRTKQKLEAISAAAAKRARSKRSSSILNELLDAGANSRAKAKKAAGDKENAAPPKQLPARAAAPSGARDSNSNEASREHTTFEMPRRKHTVIMEEPETRTHEIRSSALIFS